MPRKLLVRNDRLPYHVTARANNGERFHLHPEQMWRLIGSECHALHLLSGVEWHAFVMMPNHLHMILTVPNEDLGRVMNLFMANVTRRSNALTGRTGHVFGGPYFWSLIRSSRYFGHALKYVYRNPVRGQLCERVEEYRYSTCHGLLGESRLPFPIYYTRSAMELALPSCDPYDQLAWLNRPFPQEAEKLIRAGLRKMAFDRILKRSSRTPEKLLEDLL